MKTFPFTSVHHYLDTVFVNSVNPSEQEVKQAKCDYWKLYHSYYRKQRRKRKKEFTLGFDKKTLIRIHQRKEKLSVSEFLYKSVNNAIGNNAHILFDLSQLEILHQKLMELISLVEELLEQEDTQIIESVLIRLEHLEQQFLTYTKQL